MVGLTESTGWVEGCDFFGLLRFELASEEPTELDEDQDADDVAYEADEILEAVEDAVEDAEDTVEDAAGGILAYVLATTGATGTDRFLAGGDEDDDLESGLGDSPFDCLRFFGPEPFVDTEVDGTEVPETC